MHSERSLFVIIRVAVVFIFILNIIRSIIVIQPNPMVYQTRVKFIFPTDRGKFVFSELCS